MQPTSEADHVELARWLSGVNKFIAAVTRPASLRELLDLVTATACDLLGYEFCGVLLVQPEQRRLLMEAAHGLSSDYVEKLNGQVPISLGPDAGSDSPSTRAFLPARPFVVNDVATHPLMKPWRALAEQQGFRSIVSVPLLLKGRPFGVLNCYSARVNGVSDSSVDLLTILASQVAVAVEAIHLRDEQRAKTDGLALANESLRRQSRMLEQAEEIHKRLNDVALGGGGHEDIRFTLRGLLDREVLIDDVHGQPIAAAAGVVDGFPDTSLIALPEGAADIATVVGPFGDALTVMPVRVAGELVARMWVLGHDLGDLDRRALESASVIVALELLRMRTAQDVEWRIQGDIVDVLLHGHSSEFTGLVSRARPLGHDLEAPHQMIALGLTSTTGDNPLASPTQARAIKETVGSVLQQAGLHPLTGIDDGRLIVVLRADRTDAGERHKQIESLHRTLARRHGVTSLAVLGPICSTAAEYGRSVRLLRGASVLHRSGGKGSATITVDGMGILGLLLQIDRPQELSAYARRVIDPLREYDANRSSFLESTLAAYFEQGCSVNATAERLFVHPNTVKMRLRKAESILGLSLAKPEDMVTIRSALLIDDVMRAHGPEL